MLVELEVKSFALVDHLVMEFGPGLTALTGETGAGKSVILDSLTFLLGTATRASEGKSSCRVAGRFIPTAAVNAYLADLGLPVDDDELVIVRERREGGRTTSRLNGSIVSVNQLKGLSELLVDLCGQHQSYALTRPSAHLPILDRLGGKKQTAELAEYGRLYQEYGELNKEIASIQLADRERLREIEWLRMEIEEIDKVEPKVGELEEIEQTVKRGAASEELAEGAARLMTVLGAENGVVDGLATALATLSSLQRFDETLTPLFERLQAADIETREALHEVTAYAQTIDHDPRALDKLQGRAEAIKSLCRRFGPTTDEVIEYHRTSSERLERLVNSEDHLQELETRRQQVLEALTESAQRLSHRRREAAAGLGRELVAELAQLAMPKVAFQVEFSPLEEFGPDGKERAQFLFSPNPGRDPSPLAETASGGELSRVMLALVSIVSRHEDRPTLVLDEIDVGLGGRTAEAVAGKLARLGERMQVICVTHLPVVAAAATGHLVVEKHSDGSDTTVTVERLDDGVRVDEISRMLSGDTSKERSRGLAGELLGRFHHYATKG